MKPTKIENSEWIVGSDNIFSDLGLPDSQERLAKAKLALRINQLIKHRKLKQTQAASLLGVDQAKISLLHRGRLNHFSLERLIRFLNILEQDVEILIKDTHNLEHQGSFDVVFV